MEILGYADRLSVSPGERIRFMVSSERPRYQAEIVRLAHAYSTPKPEGFDDPVISTPVSGEYEGRYQPLHAGSYAIVDDASRLTLTRGVTVAAWIWPTTPAAGREQGIVARMADSAGFALLLDEAGRPALRLANGRGDSGSITAERPLRPRQWSFVAATYDGESGTATMTVVPAARGWLTEPADDASARLAPDLLAASRAPLLIAGIEQRRGGHGETYVAGLYNGKIDRPRIWDRALGRGEVERAGEDETLAAPPGLVAGWDFTQEMASSLLRDVSGNRLHARAVNMPARGMTGFNWTGEEVSLHAVPEQYGAVHFHDDDLDDAGWEVDFELTVPDDLASGIYAARIRSGEAEEYIPFYVRPRTGSPAAAVAFLAPTNTYLAYGNERLYSEHDYTELTDFEIEIAPEDRFLFAHPDLGLSLYDVHRDRSGVCYSSRLRPIINMRPKYRTWLNAGPRHFAADLHLVEFLETRQIRFDVVTDEDLHVDGEALLTPYKVILTGSHPEYWTTPMLEALERYLAGGGRLMYLGGNGFYWVTGMDAARPHVIEVRRGFAGTRCWESAPGETYLNLTGEPGGLWRYRGKAPNRLTGIGFTSQGWGGAEGYQRLPDSFDARVAFIFEGIAADEVIGDFGLIMGGAAGDELDRADPDLGTPPETLVLATSEGRHTDYYQLTIEDAPMMLPGMGGTENAKVRSDMTYIEAPNGGAVFSVGSINWCGSLPVNGYDNNVARVTENVLRRFSE